ncbi:hypothetical protein C7974DRAFT_407749 [Boeremia exigua]|uniref:uncharacterized protein n=1 Tax=Boeremia exigua TaxID=749465 RepID=UPI001E8D3A94|nr:uncharacterized protein C7974DRAFT_407749 [Boeremia exigua]KAH6644041.1 hypothetical protein C7974DRAFT_407749 [Boeremia exigua]
MCWITLTPTKNKRKSTSSDCSSADIVRVHHSPKPRLSDISISLPSTVASTDHHHHHHHPDALHLHHPHLPAHLHPHAPLPHGLLQHHHRHPHLHPIHPLHLHPLAPLHGAGKKIRIEAPRRAAPPPPPSSSSSSSSSSDAAAPCAPAEPVYRTQIVEPAAVRATTRSALREVRVRGGVRRVGGYDVAGRSVPWDWDCVSSTVGSSVRGGGGGRKGRRKKGAGGGLRYPPFGGLERWL